MQICTVLIVLNFDKNKILLMFIKKSLFFSFLKVNKKPSKNQIQSLLPYNNKKKHTLVLRLYY